MRLRPEIVRWTTDSRIIPLGKIRAVKFPTWKNACLRFFWQGSGLSGDGAQRFGHHFDSREFLDPVPAQPAENVAE